MIKNIGNYARHAQYWDWSGYNRKEEHEYWLRYAAKYGKNVLIPMCAWGETGAYMAERGINVTAFDITTEMIEEGKKRYNNIAGLQLLVGDVRNFRFDIKPVDFCYTTDFGHLLTMEDIKEALGCINNHLRVGGSLVIETRLKLYNEKSSYSSPQTFYPLVQMYPEVKVWKTGETRYEAKTGRTFITQHFYAQDKEGKIESFEHAFYLQSYTHEEWLEAFKECGFELVGEYNNRDVNSWQSGGAGYRIFEVVKSGSVKDK